MPWHLADAKSTTHEFLEKPFMRGPKEVGCAFAASFLVSPIVSIMDKAMVQEITGAGQFMQAVGKASSEMMYQPKKFFSGLSFRLTFVVYFGTYCAANLSEMALDAYKVRDEQKRKNIKVGNASVANIGLLAWRDSVFAREFSGGEAAKKPKVTPLRTISLFAARDTITMYATFYVAPQTAKYLIREHDVNRHVAEVSTSLTIPVLAQFVTAPLHIHAMDYYARQAATSADRVQIIKQEFMKISLARGIRILPAFGIGSYSNNKFRELFIRQPNEDLLLSRKVTKLVQRQTALIKRMTQGVSGNKSGGGGGGPGKDEKK